MKKSRIYIRMLLGYIGILAIPILIGTVLYTYTLAVTRRQGEKMNLGMLEMVRDEMDQRVDEIGRTAQRVAWDLEVQKASNVKGQFGEEDQMLLYRIYRSLNNINISESLIQDVFIYFNNTQYVVSMNGNMDASLFYDLYYAGPEVSFESFRDYMGEIHFQDIWMIPNKRNISTMLYSMTILNLGSYGGDATIVIAVNTQAFQTLLDSMKWNEDMNILIFNESGDVMTSKGGDDLVTQLKYEELEEGDYQKRELLGESCAMAVRNSGNSDWKYVTVIPERIFENMLIRIRNYSLLGLFACILLGFFISRYFALKHYNPIKNLMETFKGHVKQPMDQGEDEFQWLKRQAELFFMEKMDLDRILHDNQKSLKNYYLYQLLEASFHGTLEELQDHNIDLGEGGFLTVIFQINSEKEAEQSQERSVLEMELRRFIVNNIFKELLEEYFKVEMVEVGQDLIAIINIPEGVMGYDEFIRKNIEQVQQMTERKFDFQAIALVGDICQGLYGIHTSYVHTRELTEYVQLLEEDVIAYEEVKNRQVRCEYSIEAEHKIINAVKAGDASLAKEYMEQELNKHISQDISVETVRYLTFELMGTLLKGAEAAGSGRFAQTLDFGQFFSRRVSIEEMKRNFFGAVDTLCEEIAREQRENEQDNSLSRRVEDYIEKNFSDPDLNISITAQYFDITPSYLSSVYKKQTGRSLLDYITTLRMNRAEELLRQDYSVLEVASMTGFRDSNTFIRRFKKKKGITPGQLKKNT